MLSETQVAVRWFMQLPTHRQIRLCIRLGFTDYSTLKSDLENNKLFFGYLKDTNQLYTFLEIAKDPEAKDDDIKLKVRERKLNIITDEGNI